MPWFSKPRIRNPGHSQGWGQFSPFGARQGQESSSPLSPLTGQFLALLAFIMAVYSRSLRGTLVMAAAVLVSAVWTIGAMGLLFVSHLGLRTIGQLACLGVGLSWLSMTLVLPFLLRRFVR